MILNRGADINDIFFGHNIVCGRPSRTERPVPSSGGRGTPHAEPAEISATIRCRTTGHRSRPDRRAWRRRSGHLCRPSVRRSHAPGRLKVTRSRPVTLDAGRTAPHLFRRPSRSGSVRARAAAYIIYTPYLTRVRSIEWRSASNGSAVDLLISLERAVSSYGGPRISHESGWRWPTPPLMYVWSWFSRRYELWTTTRTALFFVQLLARACACVVFAHIMRIFKCVRVTSAL